MEPAKLRLIVAGERLFAEKGIEATSLREIATKAGQRNNNAVKYHFGSKDGLLQAIFDFRVAQMQPERESMLKLLEEQNKLESLPDLLRILFLPQLRLVDAAGDHPYAKVIIQYVTRYRTRGVPHAGDQESAHTLAVRRTVRLIAACLSHVPQTLIRDRIELCNLMCLGMIVRYEGRVATGDEAHSLEDRLADIIMMATAALSAPSI